MLELAEIQKILPQKYPFLLVDKVIDFKENESLTAIKNITGNEWTADRKTSDLDVFPEALIIEAAIQAAIILYHKSKNQPDEAPVYLLGKIMTEFKDYVGIGDQMILKVHADRLLRTGGYTSIQICTEQKDIANIQMFFSVRR